jgi:hypothetical protein
MKYNRSVLNAWLYVIEAYIYDYKNARKDKAFQKFIGDLGYYYPDEWERVITILEKQAWRKKK